MGDQGDEGGEGYGQTLLMSVRWTSDTGLRTRPD